MQNIAAKIPIVAHYFLDMKKTIEEAASITIRGGRINIVVANSVIFQEHIKTDEILAEIGAQLGLEPKIIIGSYRIADIRPRRIETRESIVQLYKA